MLTDKEALKALYIVRESISDDTPFIFSTFLRGLYYGDPYFARTPKNSFMKAYHSVLEQILSLPAVKVHIACLKEDPEVILGYSITGGEGTILHWVFVKSAWRGIGIAKELVPSTIKAATHTTSVGDSLLRKHRDVIFDPFDIR
jgi:GNAT superfamily N-acetyltransferase